MSDNAQCKQTIDGWIRDIQATAGAVAKMPAQLAPLVKVECDKAIASATSLDGEAWAPTVKDGGQALVGTQKLLDTYASGRIIWIRIKGALVFSQYGTHRQKRRSILPRAGMPKLLGNAIRTGIVDMGLPFMTRKGSHRKSTRGVAWSAGSGGKAR
jgi:hypothetical protein